MERIQSFSVDHDQLEIGMYISRVDQDIVTYDIRLVKPNHPPYLSTGSAHTMEHLFATFVRNSACKDNIVYVGPMGCRTGFYLLTRGIDHETAIALVRDGLQFITAFEGIIPGSARIECGNYLDHDLEQAKKDVLPILQVLQNYTVDQLNY